VAKSDRQTHKERHKPETGSKLFTQICRQIVGNEAMCILDVITCTDTQYNYIIIIVTITIILLLLFLSIYWSHNPWLHVK